MKTREGDLGTRLTVGGMEQPMVAYLFADDTVLLVESESILQRVVDEFDTIYKRRKWKVNVGNSKIMVFERAKDEVISFAKQYQVRIECIRSVKYGWGRRGWRK